MGSLGVLATLSLTCKLTLSFSCYCCPQSIPWDLWEVSHTLVLHQCLNSWGLSLFVRTLPHSFIQSLYGTLAYLCSYTQGAGRLHPVIRTLVMGLLCTSRRGLTLAGFLVLLVFTLSSSQLVI